MEEETAAILKNIHNRLKTGRELKEDISQLKEKKERKNYMAKRIRLNEDEYSKFLLHGNLEGRSFIKMQQNGKIFKQFHDHLSMVTEMTLNQKSKTLVSCGKDGLVVIRKATFLN